MNKEYIMKFKKEELIKLLSEAFDEGWYGYKDEKDNTVKRLADEFIKRNKLEQETVVETAETKDLWGMPAARTTNDRRGQGVEANRNVFEDAGRVVFRDSEFINLAPSESRMPPAPQAGYGSPGNQPPAQQVPLVPLQAQPVYSSSGGDFGMGYAYEGNTENISGEATSGTTSLPTIIVGGNTNVINNI